MGDSKINLVHEDLSRKIMGVLFNGYNTLGYGHPEKTYQKALAVAFEQAGVKFIEQLYSPVYFGGKLVGKNYFDFEIEGKVVLEIKKGDHFSKSHIDQVYQYLVSKNLQLGLPAYFAPTRVHWKRIVNLHPYIRTNQ